MKKGLQQKDNICIICQKDLGTTSAAKASHMRKHVRDGSVEESKDESGKLVWTSTGKEPKQPKEKIHFLSQHKSQHNVARKPVIAKSDSKGKLSIKCRECGKWNKSVQDFSDDRFVSIVCCDKMSPFPKRLIKSMNNNPGKEYIE